MSKIRLSCRTKSCTKRGVALYRRFDSMVDQACTECKQPLSVHVLVNRKSQDKKAAKDFSQLGQ